MNDNFVNIKVDREERPDVDKVYMTFIQATNGGGGWPMSVFLTPTLKPIFGGTYFPPEDQLFGRPGFKSLLKAVAGQWREDRQKILDSGDKIVDALQRSVAAEATSSNIPDPEGCAAKCFTQLLRSYDPEMGGFSKAPKFPQPVNLNFLFSLASLKRGEDKAKQALKMCLHTLEMMSKGGINDHVSKGFARYSTDSKWHVPHFEKMLYDQSQLLSAYSQAYQATKEAKFEKVILDILTYVNRDLRHPLGGYYSAEDADSYPTKESEAKKEGAFCVWTFQEIVDALKGEGDAVTKMYCQYYGVNEGGNVDPTGDPHGELKTKNVLTKLETDEEQLMKQFGIKDGAELDSKIRRCNEVLYGARQLRPRPHLDDKIVTAWNGLMISGLCSAAAALKDAEIVSCAVKTAQFLREHVFIEETGILLRSTYSIENLVAQPANPVEGFADDYAFVIQGLLALYEVTLDSEWIAWAWQLQSKQDDLFWDEAVGGYFSSKDNLVLRLKDDQDGAEPAINSVAAGNLIKLACLLDKPELEKKAESIFCVFSERLAKIPMALPEMTRALLLHQRGPVQIIISGSGGELKETAEEMINVARASQLPSKILVYADGNENSVLYENLHILKSIKLQSKATAYVCQNKTCSSPISSPEELQKILSDL